MKVWILPLRLAFSDVLIQLSAQVGRRYADLNYRNKKTVRKNWKKTEFFIP